MTEAEIAKAWLNRAHEFLWRVLTDWNNVDARLAAARLIPGQPTIWEIVNHISTCKEVEYRDFLQGEDLQMSEEDWWPPVPEVSEAAWRQTLQTLRERHERIVATAAQRIEVGLPDPARFYKRLFSVTEEEWVHAGNIGVFLNSVTNLGLRRSLAAPRERVYRAWTDPAELTRWFAPADDWNTTVHDLDVRVEGTYRIEMRAPDGEAHAVRARFRNVRPLEQLFCVWQWEGRAGEHESELTVEFVEEGEATELILSHLYCLTAEERVHYREFWTACLDRLQKWLG